MKSLIPTLFLCLLLLPARYAKSQGTAEIYDLENFVFDQLYTFTDSSGQPGYACCYEVRDKLVDGKKYMVQTFGKDLTKTTIWAFTCDDNEKLLATAYNGTDFIAIILNAKKKLLHHKIYNAAGVNEKQFIDKLDVNSLYYLEKNMPQPTDMLYKMGNYGYVSLIPTKHNDVFTYDANIFLKSTGYERKLFTPETDVKTQQASYIGSTGDLLLFYTFRKKVMASSKYESNLIGLDVATAEKRFDISTKEDDAPFLPLKVVGGTGQNDFIVLGNYFKENGRVNRTKSAGLCLLRMNATGQILARATMNWKEKFEPQTPEATVENNEEENPKDSSAKNIKHFQLHAFTKTKSGDLYIIGEAYRTGVDAGVTATNILLAGVGVGLGLWMVPQVRQTPITIMDMVVLHANSSLQIDSVYRFAKQEHRSLDFDMSFISSLPAKNQLAVAYRDYNQGGGRNHFIQKLLRLQDGAFTTLQNDFTITGATYQVLPASDKEVILAEYYPRKKVLLLSVKPLHP